MACWDLSRTWSGWGCGLVDLDNDGWLDLFVAYGGLDSNEPQPNRIFHNQSGRFSDVSADAGADFAVARLHRGAAFADFDNDGRIDIAVTSINEPIELWMNKEPFAALAAVDAYRKEEQPFGARGEGDLPRLSHPGQQCGQQRRLRILQRFAGPFWAGRRSQSLAGNPLALWNCAEIGRCYQQINCLMLRNRRLQLPPQPPNLASNLSVKRKNKPDPACRAGSFFVESDTGSWSRPRGWSISVGSNRASRGRISTWRAKRSSSVAAYEPYCL